jgi:hypothetical protein
MPSTNRRLELKAKDIDGSDRLTASCVLIDLASPAVSRTAVYASGLKNTQMETIHRKTSRKAQVSVGTRCRERHEEDEAYEVG